MRILGATQIGVALVGASLVYATLGNGVGLLPAAKAAPTQTVVAQSNVSNDALGYASGLIDDGLYDAALESLRKSPMANDLQVGEVFLEMTKLYAALGNMSKAHDLLEQSQSLLPNATARLKIEQARVHLMAGNLVHARQLLSALRNRADTSASVKEDIVMLQAKAHLAVGGVQVAQKTLQEGPAGERLVLEQVKLLVSQSDLKQAKALLEGHVATEPQAGRALLKLAQITKQLGEEGEAGKALARAKTIFNQQGDTARQREVARLQGLPPAKPSPTPRNAAPAEAPRDKQVAPALTPPVPPPASPILPPTREASEPPALEQSPLVARPFPFPPTTQLVTGSGFVIDGGRRVITNRHVIEGTTEIYVRNSLGDLSRARIDKKSSTDDLAVLVLDKAFPNKRAVTMEQFAPARAGANIAVLGFPMIDILGSVTPSITNGIVVKETGMQDAPEMFQLSAKMNKGNSGGAVVDSRGRVVGIAMGKLDTVKIMQGDGFLPEDINFAIHVARLKTLGVSPNLSLASTTREMSLEEIYQRYIGSVVMIAGR